MGFPTKNGYFGVFWGNTHIENCLFSSQCTATFFHWSLGLICWFVFFNDCGVSQSPMSWNIWVVFFFWVKSPMILLMEVLVSGIYETLWENLNIFSISTGDRRISEPSSVWPASFLRFPTLVGDDDFVWNLHRKWSIVPIMSWLPWLVRTTSQLQVWQESGHRHVATTFFIFDIFIFWYLWSVEGKLLNS